LVEKLKLKKTLYLLWWSRNCRF